MEAINLSLSRRKLRIQLGYSFNDEERTNSGSERGKRDEEWRRIWHGWIDPIFRTGAGWLAGGVKGFRWKTLVGSICSIKPHAYCIRYIPTYRANTQRGANFSEGVKRFNFAPSSSLSHRSKLRRKRKEAISSVFYTSLYLLLFWLSLDSERVYRPAADAMRCAKERQGKALVGRSNRKGWLMLHQTYDEVPSCSTTPCTTTLSSVIESGSSTFTSHNICCSTVARIALLGTGGVIHFHIEHVLHFFAFWWMRE